MIKRIISIISILVMFAGVMPQGISFAAEDVNKNEIKILNALGISLAEGRVTHDGFIVALAGLLYDEPEKNGSAEEVGRKLGMIEDGTAYSGEKALNCQDAVKYAVIALGYKQLAVRDGYLKIASDLGLIDSSLAMEEEISKKSATSLIYNMIEVEPMISYYKSEYEKGFSVAKGETLLSLNRDIYTIDGVLTHNTITSIYGEQGAGKNYVKINEKEYLLNGIAADEFLGCYVKAYVQNVEKDESALLYIEIDENKNTFFEISSEDIMSVNLDNSFIEYENEEYKIKSAKLSKSPKIIYNGVFYGDYEVQDLMPEIGNIKLIDNDTDGKYDVVFVNSYETMVIKSVDTLNKKIYGKYQFGDDRDVFELEPENTDLSYKFYKDGQEININDISTNDILSIAISKNKEDVIVTGYLSKAKIEEVVTGFDNKEKTILLDGEEYDISEEFLEYLDFSGKEIHIGEKATFYIDYFGNIAYMEKILSKDYRVLLRVYEEAEEYFAVMMNMDEEWSNIKFAKKIKYKNEFYTPVGIYAILSGMKPQVVIVELNKNGEIKSIQTATETSKYSENQFRKTPVAGYTYRSDPQTFGNIIFPEEDAKIIFMPNNNSLNKEDYYIKPAGGYFRGDVGYEICAYDADFYGFTHLIGINYSEKSGAVGRTLFIITEMTEQCFDSEVKTVIEGTYGGYINFTMIAEDKSVLEGIKTGDIIQVSTNKNGYIEYAKKIYSMSDDFVKIGAGNFSENNIMIAGVVLDADIEKSRLKMSCESDVSFRLKGISQIKVYNKKERTCETRSISELRTGDKLFCSVGWGKLLDVIKIEDE